MWCVLCKQGRLAIKLVDNFHGLAVQGFISLLSPMVYQCVILRPCLGTIFLPPLSLLRRQLVCFAVRTTQGFFSILNRFAKFRRKSIQHVING